MIGVNYKLQSTLLKQQMDHDEIYAYTWEDKENGYLILKKMCYQPPSGMLDIVKVWKK